jgi:Secretion system C-terminal sorting domain
MGDKRLKLSILLLGLGLTTYAQQATTASGGNASGSGGTVAYTVGQLVYTTNSDTTGTVSQGVQQPYEIFSVGIIETNLNISLSIFPNPTTNTLTLQIEDYKNEKLSYQLLDLQGKLLTNVVITTKNTQINMSARSAGTYMIKVILKKKEVQSFKIIKN